VFICSILLFVILKQKGEVFFYLDRDCIFKPVKWFLSHNGQRESLLVCNWLHSIGQNHFYIMLLFNRGYHLIQSLLFRDVLQSRFCTYSKSKKLDPKISSGRPCQPSGRLSVKQHPSRWPCYSVRTPIKVQKLRTVQGYIRSDVSATRPNTIQCSTRKRISFSDTDMGRQLQPSGRQVYTVRTLSLMRQDVEKICNRSDDRSTPSGCQSPYYGNCVQQKCNHLDARATPSGCSLIQERISAL